MKAPNLLQKVLPRGLLVEVFSIVIGVLLALGANEWNKQRLDRVKLATALENVAQELQGNKRLLNEIHKHNLAVIQAFDQSSETADEKKFIPGLQIRDTAWKTFLTSGVAESADVATIQVLHDHYALQEVYKNMSYQTVQTILSTKALVNGLRPETGANNFDQLFTDNLNLVVSLEEALLESVSNTTSILSNIN